MLEALMTPEVFLSLATLTFLEIVLGIDNVIFVALMAGRLPEAQRPKARALGLGLALIFRVIMLFGLVWIAHLEEPVFSVAEFDVSWRDVILMAGGLFLIVKATLEIHHNVEGEAAHAENFSQVQRRTRWRHRSRGSLRPSSSPACRVLAPRRCGTRSCRTTW